MKIFSIIVVSAVSLFTLSCSEKSASDGDKKLDGAKQELKDESHPTASAASEKNRSEAREETEADDKPETDMVEEDCVAFLRATTIARTSGGSSDCPGCPATTEVPEVLKFGQVKIDRFSPGEERCEVSVRIYGTFNPSRGGDIVGGLTRWISSEQKAQYARGETPSGEQVYPVKAIYRRTPQGWRVVEFD
ncbi:MAG TPA: hypothetical protein VK474_03290 [Chthoniobacterales bacterium]|nr:hypothetical protein [Chthoniobacterales bacterium]